ncbi:MAG: penicillin-binding protein activator [Gammaproteobacteria bacterium]|nr:penicillin-binding protein activator [Gammaproteobacteria bacterium]
MPSTSHKCQFALLLMSVIVGAACQPLQPPVETSSSAPAAGTARTPAAGQAQPAGAVDTGSRTRTASVPPGAPAPTWQPGTARDPDAPVALLLPLSGRQQSAGMAVRDGFIAAHLGSVRSRQQVLVYDVARLGVGEAYAQAQQAGAGIVVGPLLRESVQALNQIAGVTPVLALNYLPDGESARAGFWQFGLAPEDETWEIAARAVSLGQLRAISLAPDNSWGRRMQAAFQDSFAALGGQVVAARLYPPGESDFSPELRAALAYQDKSATFAGGRRQDIDLVFLAATSTTGKLIWPQLRFYGAGNLPTYSTSAIWEDGDSNANDLNGISFPDGPWMIAPDSRSALLKSQVARYWGPQSLGLSRLYALGYDAWQLLPTIGRQTMAGPFRDGELRGVTGTLNADSMGRIHRRLQWATVRGGQPTPALLPASDIQPVFADP